jgi:cephalosporin hydroxylase
VGTGAPMTIDTAGSDFDTVVAIYTVSAGSYIPVPDGCVDDSPTEPIGRTLQANVTIPTVAGTTYLVQIGGYPEDQPYGNLRVALR